MGKAKERGISGLLSEFRPRRNNFFPAAMPLSFYLPGSLLLTHMPQPFRAVDRNIGIRIFRFQSGSSLQSPAFLRVDPCCFSGRIIFFFQKGCGGCICMVLFFPQNPFFHFFGVAYFIAQSLFSNI